MPTASPASSGAAKAGSRSPGARAAASGSAASRRNQSRVARTKSARTRPRSAAGPSKSDATPGADALDATSSGAFGDYAERAILIPVGAALIARERVVAGVNGTISSYSSSSRARAQLRRFERRGSTARNRLERDVRKTRVRVERELRQRRREIERTVSGLDDRRGAVRRNGTDLANRVPELANRVQERILSIV
jgi:hypothetical protein